MPINLAQAKAKNASLRLFSDSYDANMPKNIKEIRRDRLWALLVEHQNNRADLARTLKKSAAQTSQWLHGQRSISEDSARDIERSAKKPPGWMDADQEHKGHKLHAVAEPVVGYNSEADWPLQHITPHQLRRLQPGPLRLVEEHIRLVLAMPDAVQPDPDQWRRIALEIAAQTDHKAGADTFTQFCLAVDRQLAKARASETKKAEKAAKH